MSQCNVLCIALMPIQMSTILLFWFSISFMIVSIPSETVQCSAEKTCICLSDGLCILDCTGDQQCKSSKTVLNCRDNYPCIIICDSSNGKESCLYALINGNSATNVTLICRNGEISCKSAIFDCDSATHCNTQCSGDLGCEDTQIKCQNSDCSVDCESQQTCSSININKGTKAFECTGNCPNNVPAPFATYTDEPTVSPTNNPSLSPTKTHFTTLTTNYPTTSEYQTIFPSRNPTNFFLVPNSTQTQTMRPTDYSGNIIATKVATISTTNINRNLESSDGISVRIWLYIGIGVVVLCLVIGFLIFIKHRKKKAKELFSGNKPKSPSSKRVPSNFQIALVEENDNHTANLDVFKDINENKSPKTLTPPNTFEEGLMNKIAANNLMMDDVIENMVTPGNIGTLENKSENIATRIEMKLMNPLKEGDNDIGSDDEIVNYVNDVDVITGITKSGFVDDIDNIANNVQNEDQDVWMQIDNMVSTKGEINDIEIVYQVNEMITQGGDKIMNKINTENDDEEYDIQYDDEDD
eukprot:502279_1